MQEVGALCDEVVVIAHGTVVASGTPAEIQARTGERRWRMRSCGSSAPARGWRDGALGMGGHPERVFRKEFRENLRDRRTLSSALIFGPLFGPLLFAAGSVTDH